MVTTLKSEGLLGSAFDMVVSGGGWRDGIQNERSQTRIPRVGTGILYARGGLAPPVE
jgi:hypothetical protein